MTCRYKERCPAYYSNDDNCITDNSFGFCKIWKDHYKMAEMELEARMKEVSEGYRQAELSDVYLAERLRERTLCDDIEIKDWEAGV